MRINTKHKSYCLLLIFISISLISCDSNEEKKIDKRILTLEANKNWPYEIKGKIEVADAHQRTDGTLDWASAVLVFDDQGSGIPVSFDRETIIKSGLNIESDELFIVSLNKPIKVIGANVYPVSNIKKTFNKAIK